ncbi:hypothetical protein NDU88_003819 [Pleurodeles waltl]|uniref:Uncharacterized protein n=1 Tax=Pleurodeles waltl TaxID=8319 RepID=A0AAV7NKH3_PLEWA|nr:hypothetical protein NDU88_003819 [Pleurodeles waltl]
MKKGTLPQFPGGTVRRTSPRSLYDFRVREGNKEDARGSAENSRRAEARSKDLRSIRTRSEASRTAEARSEDIRNAADMRRDESGSREA